MSGENRPDPAVELLYDNIGSLPDSQYGHINLLPFLHESDTARALKRKVCEAVVHLFRDSGYPMDKNDESKTIISRDITINCRMCSGLLLKTHVDEDGRANVPAATVIASLAKLDGECPHTEITPEIQRQRIEQAVLAAQGNK